MRSLPRLLLGFSAVILAFGAFMHANAFERAMSAVAASNLGSFYAQSFKALWLIDSATLLILAICFGLASARPRAMSRAVIILLACIPAVTAFFQYLFLGTFLPAHMLLLAAVAAIFGAFGVKAAGKAGVLLGLGMLLFAPRESLAQTPERAPVVTTPHFAFYSDFDTNLNDALIAAGVARKSGKPELFHSGSEVSCFGKLPQSARAAWDGAAGYYAEIISPSDWTARQQYLLRVQLAGFDEELKDAGDRQFVEIARSFRAAATPAYKECRWAAQDEKNRRWIEELKPRLAADEQKIAPRLEQLYRKRWNGLPIPVDVVETVDWSGANSILRDPAEGHLLISSSVQGPAALEVVFHEASHLLMGRGDPLRQALDSAASAVDFRLPGDLWHVVLFYTTGEAVRRILDDGGLSGYTPMVYEIFDRSTWGGYRKALESAWRPYINGERTLSEAAACLIETLRKPEDRNPATGKGSVCQQS